MTTPDHSQEPKEQEGQDVEFWQELHDGEITKVSGEVPGVVELCVEIEYLAEMLEPSAKSIVITLHGCSRFELAWTRKDIPVITWPEARTSAQEATIMGKGRGESGITVAVIGGELRLDYGRATLALDSGRQVSHSELVEAGHKYWKGLPRWPCVVIAALMILGGLLIHVLVEWLT